MTESVKKNKEIRTNRYFWIACIVLVLLQYGLCIHYGLKRQYLFCDEVYSYGLANSTDKTFLHPGEDNTPLDEWVTGSYFENYMNYNDDSFNYSAAYRNQENDVHPPVYYMLLAYGVLLFQRSGIQCSSGNSAQPHTPDICGYSSVVCGGISAWKQMVWTDGGDSVGRIIGGHKQLYAHTDVSSSDLECIAC